MTTHSQSTEPSAHWDWPCKDNGDEEYWGYIGATTHSQSTEPSVYWDWPCKDNDEEMGLH